MNEHCTFKVARGPDQLRSALVAAGKGTFDYALQAAARSVEARSARRLALIQRRSAYEVALESTRRLHGYMWPRALHLRLDYIGPSDIRSRLPKAGVVFQPQLIEDDLPDRPPLTALLARNEEALRLHLVLLFAAACLVPPAERPTRIVDRLADVGVDLRSLLMLSGVSARNSSLRLQRSLQALEAQTLVKIPQSGSRRQYESLRILNETRSGRAYVVPGSRGANPQKMRTPEGMLAIPLSFFLNGWHLVLTGSEIATYLMLLHATQIGLHDSANRAEFRV